MTDILNHFQNAQFVALALDALLKSFVMLALAGGVCALWRGASAATRHLIWFLALASLPFLPLLNSPQPWQRPLWTISAGVDSGNQFSLALNFAPKGMAQRASGTMAGQEWLTANAIALGNTRELAAHFNANWITVGFAVWLAGAGFILLAAGGAQLRLQALSRRVPPLRDAQWTHALPAALATMRVKRQVKLLHSVENLMPMTWGWRRPVILLPAEAAQWPEERRRVVLLHELAHVKRADCLTQLAAQIVCAIFWFNPLVWLAAQQMRVERELACDDLVLAGGCKASDYATHLVEIAARFQRVPFAAAIAMARPSRLEGRIAAIVDASRNRRQRTAAAIAILALIGGIAVCIGGSGMAPAGDAAKAISLRQQQIERLKKFSSEKEQQSQLLAAAAGETISPEFQKFFTAATTGDWQTVTNSYESFKQRHPQYGKNGHHSDVSLRTSFWGPVLEICLAYDHVVRCEPQYTQMAVDGIVISIPPGSIYFGGTDPGRGLPTAFCKSHVEADPFYTLTQNALADGTYLAYLRGMYGDRRELSGQMTTGPLTEQTKQLRADLAATQLEIAEAQKDGDSERRAVSVTDLERKAKIQRANLESFESTLEQTRRENPLPAKAIYIPTAEDSQKCFQDYVADASQRADKNQLKPGEEFKKESSGQIQVSGQAAVMAINGLLVKTVMERNPDHEFYIEESFPLDWMYPNLEPHGLIFKLNRQPLTSLSDETVRQDRDYWQPRVNQMIGPWLKDATSVKDVIAFAEKVFLRHDLSGFTGDPRFVQNDYATRMLSKWRSAIAGLYAWRAEHADATGDQERLARAADYAFRQALALCPSSPEAVKRYAEFLKARQRGADARLVTGLADEFKPKAKLTAAAKATVFQMRLVLDAPTADSELLTNHFGAASATHPAEALNLQKTVLLDHTAIKSAELIKDQFGHPQIGISLTKAGTKKFAEITREHLHQRLAIVVDGKLCSAPKIQSEITGGAAVISGNFSEDEAKELTDTINDVIKK